MLWLQGTFNFPHAVNVEGACNDVIISRVPFFFPGIIYDVIVEPPSIGSTTDEKGNSKPVSCYTTPTDYSVVSSLYVCGNTMRSLAQGQLREKN